MPGTIYQVGDVALHWNSMFHDKNGTFILEAIKTSPGNNDNYHSVLLWVQQQNATLDNNNDAEFPCSNPQST